MFSDAESFNQPLENWKVSNLVDTSGVLVESGMNEKICLVG